MSDDRTATRGKFRLSQEMIAIIIFGITLATQQLYLVWDIREAGRAWRAVPAVSELRQPTHREGAGHR